jgi:nicotinate-nucleotide pyrophosphorylase (carboxylating)
VPARAEVVAQSTGVVSGVGAAAQAARLLGVRTTPLLREGDRVRRGQVVLRLSGDARGILAAERTLLNLLMHLSGVATSTAEAVRRAGGKGASIAVFATRKTLPGLRDLEKAAVVHGGGFPHRRDLSDGVLIKNNHLSLVSLPDAIGRARRRVGARGRVQVEVRDARSALAAARAGADSLLIDNASPRKVREIVGRLRSAGMRKGVWLEVSGGITARTVGRYRRTGVDAASLGSLTHSAPALPFHLVLSRHRRQ